MHGLPRLASIPGLSRPEQLRNDRAFGDTCAVPSVEQSFFGVPANTSESGGAKKSRANRRKAVQLQELRTSLDIMEIFVPTNGDDG